MENENVQHSGEFKIADNKLLKGKYTGNDFELEIVEI